MKLTAITGNGIKRLAVSTEQITAVFLPTDMGSASVDIIAVGEKGYEYPIPEGDGLTESKALFTGKNVKIAAVVTGFSTEFDIEIGQ